MNSQPIGLFDSGVGGLTVVREMQAHLPGELLCYFGDTARVPYGVKSAETVTRYSLEITQFLITHDVKMLVIACNTASSVALDAVRSVFDGPVLGVVEPGVRAAVSVTRNGCIGIIGTRSTISSGSYQSRLLEHDPGLHIAAAACPLFVPLAEEGWFDSPISRDIAKAYLQPLLDEGIDTLILGCTHFPLLAPLIQSVAGDGVVLVRSADEVTREVSSTLEKLDLRSERRTRKDLFYASDDISGFEKLYRQICNQPHAGFVEAGSQFFEFVQQIPQFRERIHSDPQTWFEPL